jgi:hypothetical protein
MQGGLARLYSRRYMAGRFRAPHLASSAEEEEEAPGIYLAYERSVTGPHRHRSTPITEFEPVLLQHHLSSSRTPTQLWPVRSSSDHHNIVFVGPHVPVLQTRGEALYSVQSRSSLLALPSFGPRLARRPAFALPLNTDTASEPRLASRPQNRRIPVAASRAVFSPQHTYTYRTLSRTRWFPQAQRSRNHLHSPPVLPHRCLLSIPSPRRPRARHILNYERAGANGTAIHVLSSCLGEL